MTSDRNVKMRRPALTKAQLLCLGEGLAIGQGKKGFTMEELEELIDFAIKAKIEHALLLLLLSREAVVSVDLDKPPDSRFRFYSRRGFVSPDTTETVHDEKKEQES